MLQKDKANELRLGNLVYYKYWNPHPANPSFEFEIVKIVGFLKGNYYFEFLNKKGVHKIGELHPIPLTEEILLKCGFDVKWLLIDCEGYYVLMCDKKIRIKFVHSLQNFYLCMEQKELNLCL